MVPAPVGQAVSTAGTAGITAKDLLSFAQAVVPLLVWPIFWTIVLLCNRDLLRRLLVIMTQRIQSGASVQIGPVAIGEAPKLTALPKQGVKALVPAAAPPETAIPPYADIVYLVHSVGRLQIDSEGKEARPAAIWVDADASEILEQIERVTYHLHPTVSPGPQTVTTRTDGFRLSIPNLQGEFNIRAELFFKGYKTPLQLRRYINFYRSTVIERMLLSGSQWSKV